MAVAYKLTFERHIFHADKCTIQPITYPPTSASAQKQPKDPSSDETRRAILRRGQLRLLLGSTDQTLAYAQYPIRDSSMKIHFMNPRQTVTLTHSWVFVDPYGHGTENPLPKRKARSNKIEDGSRGCYTGLLPDGTKIRWESLGPNGAGSKREIKMRCVIVDAQEKSGDVVGELLKSNDIVRLMNLEGRNSYLETCVLLGFLSLFERARSRNRNSEFQVDAESWMYEAGGDGGDGGGGGGDGGGGGGDGGGGGGGDGGG